MRYVEIAPPPPLAPFVECFWAMDGPALEEESDEPIVPDGCMEIVFHVGAPFRRRGADDGSDDSQHMVAVVGQIERAIDLVPTGPVGLVGVRLRSDGAAAFLGTRADELTHKSVALDAVFEREARDLERAVFEASDAVAALPRLAAALQSRAAIARDPNEGLVAAVALARATDGAADVSALAARAGVSTRQLERRFSSDVGLSPKRFLRVLRVHKAARLLGTGRRPIDVAFDCGYFDESHLHRDFRDIVGVSPGRWASASHALADPLLR